MSLSAVLRLHPHFTVNRVAASVGGTPSVSSFSASVRRCWRWALVVIAMTNINRIDDYLRKSTDRSTLNVAENI